jgi:hypothetical protein
MRIVFGLGLLGAACLIACGSSSKGGGPGGSGGDSSGGAENIAGNAGNAGAGHKAGASNAGDGSGGDAGSGDEPPVVSAAKPHTAGGLVAGGTVGHSAHFTGVFTLGAAPGGNGLTTSKSQQLRGGVLGASQK